MTKPNRLKKDWDIIIVNTLHHHKIGKATKLVKLYLMSDKNQKYTGVDDHL
jgi:hypothetical protein